MSISQYGVNVDVPSQVRNVFSNYINILDDYILMCTAENEYTGLIINRATKNVTEYKFTRATSGYNTYYRLAKREIADFTYTVENEMYVYSNHLGGSALNCSIYEQVTSYSMAILVCLVSFAVLFKGVLFKCLKSKK